MKYGLASQTPNQKAGHKSGYPMKGYVLCLTVVILLCRVAQPQTSGPGITGFLVNGVSSSTGPVGATLTIQGSGFGATIGFSTVTLNGIALAGNGVKPTSWSNTSIVVVIPKTASSGPVIVKVSGKLSNSVNFTIGALISGISGTSGLAGTPVTIQGAGFGTAGGTVTFNGTIATTTGWTDSSIVAQVPAGATAGPIVVTVGGQSSNGVFFTPTPSITSISPSSGLSGTSVTITGNSFGTQSSSVAFSGVSATVIAWSNTSISVNAPAGALTGNVVVTVNGIPSAGQLFTYTPQISSVSPNPALAESSVTIQGINFGGQQGTSTVTFNGLAAAVSGWTNSTITATVPDTATAGPVVVTVNGVNSNGISFALPGLYTFRVSYEPDGDVLSASDSVNGNWTYTYDGFNRLSTANNSSPVQGFSYVYDQYGNRWQQNLTAGTGGIENLTFTAAPAASTTGNCFHAAGRNNQPDGFCFDAAGNLLNDGQHSYRYDAENRIIAVDNGQSASYTYDVSGRRIQKIGPSGTSAYLYDLNGRVITELDSNGDWVRGEVYAGDRHLATYRNGTTYFIQSDWLATERARFLPSGDLSETCANLPFGDGLNCKGSADPSPNHFTGKEHDSESNLDYFGARYYSSGLGRFVTPDWSANATAVPYANFGNPQSLNLYRYGGNNPTSFGDRDGHQDPTIGIGLPPICGLCFAVVQAYHEIRTNPRQAAQDALGGVAGALQQVVDLLPYGDNKPTPSYTPPKGATVPNSAVGTLAAFATSATLAALPVPKGTTVVDMTPTVNAPSVIGDFMKGVNPESMVHLTPFEPEAFAAGVRPGTYWSQLSDVAGLTPDQYRVSVVGPAAAGYSPTADLFVVASPDSAAAFEQSSVSVFGYPEYTNSQIVIPDLFVEVPPGPPIEYYPSAVPSTATTPP